MQILRTVGGLLLVSTARAAVPDDKVKQLPGFDVAPFDVYSGYLTVPGPFEQSNYTSLKIHYQFHASQHDPKTDPIASWHQGGPGSDSIAVGLYTEMGYFQVDSNGTYINEYAWNNVASMLYLESPAGSGGSFGFSECIVADKPVDCYWNDTSQAEAYAHSLTAFFDAFPEYKENDFYLTGESYAGQYVPNIAHYILNNEPFTSKINLKGFAIGNACWGGNETKVNCNGPNHAQMMSDIYFGKALSSKELYKQIQETCSWPEDDLDTGADDFEPSAECEKLLGQQAQEAGPHNIYNIYDNCPRGGLKRFLKRTGLTMYDLGKALQKEMDTGGAAKPLETLQKTHMLSLETLLGEDQGDGQSLGDSASTPINTHGGYPWSCGGYPAGSRDYLGRDDVMKALHISDPGRSVFHYHSSGPASITLHPQLAKKLRVLIYNGDADACVPYKGNEEWVSSLVKKGDLVEKDSWRPWFNALWPDMPAGYVTTYNVTGAPNKDFSFLTIRLAGHMVPTFQPASSLTFFQRFLAAEPFTGGPDEDDDKEL